MASRITRKKAWLVRLLYVVLGMAVFTPVHAEPAPATISGTVKAVSGSPVSNAQIFVTNTATGDVASLTLDPDGSYAVTGLAAGTYELTASAPGFAQSTLTITIRDGSASTADLVLQEGDVDDNALRLNGSSPSGEGLSAEAISELPLNGRSATDAAALEPGVMRTRTQGRTGPNGFGSQMAIFGGRPRQNSSRLNGISVNDYGNGPLGNAVGTTLGVDGLEQLTVMTRNDQAQFGRSSGGYISSATRSGTSNFHGSAFEYFRDDRLDATDYFATTKPSFRRNQFGGSIGGPILADRLLFFVTYEGIRQSEGTTSIIIVPSAATRAGLLCSAPQAGAACAPNAVAVNPEIRRYLDAFYPVPSNSDLIGNGDTGIVVGSGLRIRPGNHVTGRMDYKPSERNSVYGVYSFENGSNTGPDRFIEKLFANVSRQQYFTVGYAHTFSPRVVNSLRLGVYRMSSDVGNTFPGSNALSGDSSYGFVPGQSHGQIRVPGLSSLGNGLGGPDRYLFHWTSLQAYDDISWQHGAHSFKFGVALERMRDNIDATANLTGEWVFNSLSDFLTNRPFSFSAAVPGSTIGRQFRQTIAAGYVQDDWLMRRNLSVSMGLRYEMATVPSEVNGRTTALAHLTDPQPRSGAPLFANPTLRNFAPRIGFAWDVLSSGFLVMTSGFGVFDVLPLPYQVQSGELFSAPFYGAGSVTTASTAPLQPGDFPNGGYGLASTSTNGLAQAYFEPHPKRNYVMQWNYTLQWRLPLDFSVKTGYVGSRGVHQIFRVKDANMVLPTLTSAGYLWPNPRGSGTRLNPAVGTITAAFWNGDSYYNAFVLQVRKQIRRGLQVGGSYTWGKSIDTSSGSVEGDEYSNALSSPLWFDTRLNRGQSDYDITHSLKVTYSWQLPSPRLDFAAAEWALGGWQVGGVFEASSGIPFTPGFGGDPLGVNSIDTNVDVPSVVSGPGCETLTNPGSVHYIKTECLQVPRATPAIAANCVNANDSLTNAPDPTSCLNLRGNLGRNALTGPGQVNMNFTVFKNNYLRDVSDVFNVQFRAEFFNLFNRPTFSAPLENKNVFDSKGNPLGNGGLIESTQGGPRNIQLAVRVIW
jgi:Carboxypeptidase regulatory-like domain